MKKYLLLPLLLIAVKVSAQNPVVTQQEKMKDALTLAGTWKGSGWALQAGEKHTFEQTEVVTAKMNGAMLIVEGNGKDQNGRPVHTALGLLTYDNGRQAYKWTAYSYGYVTEVVPIMAKGSMIWNVNTREGMVRYTINYTDTEWYEKGELSTNNGQTWVQNFEMKLKKS